MHLKSKEILDYFQFKGKITAAGFSSLLRECPKVGFNGFHPGQQKVIEAYEERIPARPEARELGLEFEYKYNTFVIACGRRWGKSWMSSILGAMELLVPNSKVMIVSYALSNCETIFDHISKIITGLGIELTVNRRKDMELELINGSTLVCASVENVESRLGKSISLLLLDEARLFKKELYSQVLTPMLLDYSPYARTVLISSPAPGWFEEAYKMGQSTEAKYDRIWSFNSPTHMNSTIPREKLEEMRETMSEALYNQEVLGMFTSKEGAVFPEFDPEANVFTEDEFPEFYSWLTYGNVIFQTIDSGFTHYFASQWVLYVEEVDHYFVFREYNQNKTLTPKHAENIHRIEADLGIEVVMRYADPAASQQIFDFTAYDLYYNKSDKNTRETINNLNTLFFQRSAVTGRPKLLISKSCRETIRQLTEIQWKEDSHGQTREQAAQGVKPFRPDNNNQKTDWDLIDSLRYGMYSFAKNTRVGCSVFQFDSLEDNDDEDDFTKAISGAGWIKMQQL